MDSTPETQAHLDAVDELEAHITSPEDAAQLEAWRKEAEEAQPAQEQARQEAVENVGREVTKLVIGPDGTVLTPRDLAELDKAADSDIGPYKKGQR